MIGYIIRQPFGGPELSGWYRVLGHRGGLHMRSPAWSRRQNIDPSGMRTSHISGVY